MSTDQNDPLFDGLDEADRELLRSQIELNYLAASRSGSIWFYVLAAVVAGALFYFTKLAPEFECPAGSCSAGLEQQRADVSQFAFWLVAITSAILGWVLGLIRVSLKVWKKETLAKMFAHENVAKLNQAAALARQQVDNTIMHRQIQRNLGQR